MREGNEWPCEPRCQLEPGHWSLFLLEELMLSINRHLLSFKATGCETCERNAEEGSEVKSGGMCRRLDLAKGKRQHRR